MGARYTLPAEVHGKEVVVVAFCWIGEPSKSDELTKPLHGFGKPFGADAGPMPFAGWQTAFDPLLAPTCNPATSVVRSNC